MAKILVFASILFVCCSGIAGQSTTISFDEYGFSMAKPDGWYQVEKRVLDDSISQLDLSNPAREKLKADDDDSQLLFLFTRWVPDSKRGVNPKIEARLIPTGLHRALSFAEFQPAITKAFLSFDAGRINYFFLKEPTAIDIDGGKGVYQISRFTIRTNKRTEYTIRSRTLAIPYKTYYFQISFVDEFGGEDCSAVFDELVKSIKISNHI
jgi:hypothetical protein